MGNSFSANSVYNYISQMITLYNAASNPHHSYDDTDNVDTCDVDKALVSQLKKSIMRLFNTYSTLVYNEKENTVYKKIENNYDAQIYRYYSNGAVYSITYGDKRDYVEKKESVVTLCDSIIFCEIAVFLDPYNVPPKMQKLIDDNKDKIIANQKNTAIEEKQDKIKKTIKKSSSKQIDGPYSNIKNFLCFNKNTWFFDNRNNGYNDFIKFQAKKWYGKEININMIKKSTFFTKIFPPNMYKIYEALNKLNDLYNIRVGKNEMINTFYYKDPVYDKYGHKIREAIIDTSELGFLSGTYYDDDYLDNAYFPIIKAINDIMKKTYNQGNFEKMFRAIDNGGQLRRFLHSYGLLRHTYNTGAIIDDDIKDKEAAIKDLTLPDNIVKPVSLFLGAKNKDHFEKMVNDYYSYDKSSYGCIRELLKDNNAIKLDDIKMTSYLVTHSNKTSKDRYQYRYFRVNNYIPNPALHFFCTAYKNFVEQVKACEFGEEWLKFRGFIAPDPPAKKKSGKKTKTKTKKEVKKND